MSAGFQARSGSRTSRTSPIRPSVRSIRVEIDQRLRETLPTPCRFARVRRELDLEPAKSPLSCAIRLYLVLDEWRISGPATGGPVDELLAASSETVCRESSDRIDASFSRSAQDRRVRHRRRSRLVASSEPTNADTIPRAGSAPDSREFAVPINGLPNAYERDPSLPTILASTIVSTADSPAPMSTTTSPGASEICGCQTAVVFGDAQGLPTTG